MFNSFKLFRSLYGCFMPNSLRYIYSIKRTQKTNFAFFHQIVLFYWIFPKIHYNYLSNFLKFEMTLHFPSWLISYLFPTANDMFYYTNNNSFLNELSNNVEIKFVVENARIKKFGYYRTNEKKQQVE